MDAIQQLLLFTERATELRGRRLLAEKRLKAGVTIRWEAGRDGELEERLPDHDDLLAYLALFRQFISNGEPIFVNRIYSLCRQALLDSELKTFLLASHKHWSNARSRGAIRLVYGSKAWTPLEVTRVWLNGEYFHSDFEKRQQLASLDPLQRACFRFVFLNFVIDATDIVLYLADGIAKAMRDGLVTSAAPGTVRPQRRGSRGGG